MQVYMQKTTKSTQNGEKLLSRTIWRNRFHFKNQCFKQDKNDGTTKKLMRESCISSLFSKVQENFHSNLVNDWRLLRLKVI
jgi:hypothetical protein